MVFQFRVVVFLPNSFSMKLMASSVLPPLDRSTTLKTSPPETFRMQKSSFGVA